MYYLQVICLYIALEDIIDLLNFSDIFDKNLNNTFNKKLFILTIYDILLPVNPYLPWNSFTAQHIN